jgi:CubicO group peptidase (beta-lactamase class C family)
LPGAQAVIEAGIQQGLHIGAQVFVSVSGQPVADLAVGESRPGVAMMPDTLMLWMSASKPVAAVAVLQLEEQGRLELRDAVAAHIPEFAAGGKEEITVQHLLTHTGGFRMAEVGGPGDSWDEIIARICRTKLERGWVPGEKAGYHVHSSWYILGEIVGRLSGQSYSSYVRQEIFEPLGMLDSWIGMPLERFEAYGERLGVMQNTEKPGLPPHRWSTEEGCTHCAPGGNGHGPIRELGYFYEMLLSGGQRLGRRVLSTDSVARMTSRQRQGMFDQTFKHVMDWGLGLIIDSNRYGADTVPYGYGRYCSPETFGHSGSQSSVGFADPARGLAVGVVFNGMPGERKHQARIKAVNEAIYMDLGFV